MSVTGHTESDDVLETLHKGSVPHAELMLAVRGRKVTQNDRQSTVCFYFKKLLLEPCELVSRVLTLTQNVEV